MMNESCQRIAIVRVGMKRRVNKFPRPTRRPLFGDAASSLSAAAAAMATLTQPTQRRGKNGSHYDAGGVSTVTVDSPATLPGSPPQHGLHDPYGPGSSRLALDSGKEYFGLPSGKVRCLCRPGLSCRIVSGSCATESRPSTPASGTARRRPQHGRHPLPLRVLRLCSRLSRRCRRAVLQDLASG